MSQDSTQQGEGTGVRPSGEFGVFIFIGSEAMLFGGLILSYVVARLHHHDAFVGGSAELSLFTGTLNTAILLTSSFAVALATIWGEEAGKDRRTRLALGVTAVLGVLFLCVKAYEYYDEAQRHVLPALGLPFDYSGPDPEHARLFFDAYLALTGTHGLHVLTGIGLILTLALGWKRIGRPAHWLKLAALYWHFIDVIWVFLFPILYMVR
jgi:cytochrome c oxidase subunit 3